MSRIIFTLEQIDFAATQINRIDSGEKNLFFESVNTGHQIEAKIFYDDGMVGVLYGCTVYKSLRIRISFEKDTDKFNTELASCIKSALNKAGLTSCDLWIRNENKKIIEFLKQYFHILPEGKYYYASIEFIVQREKFNMTANQSVLDVRLYEEKHIDRYLSLLDGSWTHSDPPWDFSGKKDDYLKLFAVLKQNDTFEAFWKDGTLVGLYWRKNAEIDFFAVDINHQRKGYGTIMLTRALDMVFQKTDADFAYLYAVDWNIKGQSFYKKYGMEQNGHSYHLHIKDYIEKGR